MANYNLFISHSWAYSDAYDKLVELLDSASYFSYSNYSVPKDDPIHNAPDSQKLYDAIKEQMSHASVILIMAGKYATYSAWIKKEIKIAKSEFFSPKHIIGIKPWANTQVSSVVNDNADRIVGWNTNSVVTAIRELS